MPRVHYGLSPEAQGRRTCTNSKHLAVLQHYNVPESHLLETLKLSVNTAPKYHTLTVLNTVVSLFQRYFCIAIQKCILERCPYLF